MNISINERLSPKCTLITFYDPDVNTRNVKHSILNILNIYKRFYVKSLLT